MIKPEDCGCLSEQDKRFITKWEERIDNKLRTEYDPGQTQAVWVELDKATTNRCAKALKEVYKSHWVVQDGLSENGTYGMFFKARTYYD